MASYADSLSKAQKRAITEASRDYGNITTRDATRPTLKRLREFGLLQRKNEVGAFELTPAGWAVAEILAANAEEQGS